MGKKFDEQIILELKQITDALTRCEEMFNSVEDEKLIEAAIYERFALHARLEYLIKVARTKGVTISFEDRMKGI